MARLVLCMCFVAVFLGEVQRSLGVEETSVATPKDVSTTPAPEDDRSAKNKKEEASTTSKPEPKAGALPTLPTLPAIPALPKLPEIPSHRLMDGLSQTLEGMKDIGSGAVNAVGNAFGSLKQTASDLVSKVEE